jgi:hypothetical protein
MTAKAWVQRRTPLPASTIPNRVSPHVRPLDVSCVTPQPEIKNNAIVGNSAKARAIPREKFTRGSLMIFQYGLLPPDHQHYADITQIESNY